MSRIQRAFCSRSFGNILILSLSSLTLGIYIAYPSPALVGVSKKYSFTDIDSGLFCAITSLTAILGPFYSGLFMNTKGRKIAVQAIALLGIFSWLILLFGSNKRYAIVHRAVAGITAGGISSVLPVYIMEVSPVEFLNIYGTMHQFSIAFGIFVINLLGMFMSWKGLAYFTIFLSVLIIILTIQVPESPVFNQLMHNNGVVSNVASENICHKRYMGPLFVGFLLMVFQQFSGINAVLSNLTSIVKSKSGPAMAASAQCISCILCLIVMDRLGRMMTWAISTFGSAGALFMLSTATSPMMQTVAAFAFLFFFCFGLGPIPWVVTPELFPDRLRSTSSSLFSSMNWILSFIVVFFYPTLLNTIGNAGTLRVFAIVLVVGGVAGFSILKNRREGMETVDEAPSLGNIMVDLNDGPL